MSHFLNCLIALTVVVTMIDATGFPSGGGCCMQSCCSSGCGRKKREAAVQPHYKADETPCPQATWKPILEEAILPEDAVASVSAIQTGLFRRFSDQKFLVTCSTADEKTGTATGNKVHFSSSGDGYCNLVKEKVWCQAVALSA